MRQEHFLPNFLVQVSTTNAISSSTQEDACDKMLFKAKAKFAGT